MEILIGSQRFSSIASAQQYLAAQPQPVTIPPGVIERVRRAHRR